MMDISWLMNINSSVVISYCWTNLYYYPNICALLSLKATNVNMKDILMIYIIKYRRRTNPKSIDRKYRECRAYGNIV